MTMNKSKSGDATDRTAFAGSVPVCETCGGRGFIDGWDRVRQTPQGRKCPDCIGPHWAMLKGGGNLFEQKEQNR